MAEKVVETCYICKSGHKHATEEEADGCDRELAMNEAIHDIGDNPDFEEAEHKYDIDADDYEVEYEPKDATSLSEVQEVTVTVYGKGYDRTVYRKK